MKIFTNLLLAFSIAGMVSCGMVYGATLANEKNKQFDLNRASPNMMQKHLLGSSIVQNRVHTVKAVYDFDVNGGAITTSTNLLGIDGKAVVIPNKAIIIGCIIDVETPATTSASGTIAISAQSAGDLKAALAAASWTGLLACVPVQTAASSIKMTADRTLTYAIATGAITAGKIKIDVQYIMSE